MMSFAFLLVCFYTITIMNIAYYNTAVLVSQLNRVPSNMTIITKIVRSRSSKTNSSLAEDWFCQNINIFF